MDVIIDCGSNIHPETGPSARQKVISIQWPDGGIPDMAAKDWRALLKLIQEQKKSAGKGELNVLVCCSGGHGRTGTALAVIAALTGTEPDDPVTFVRSQYCLRAVETKAQCGYVRGIMRLLADKPSDTPPDSCEADLRWP